MEAIEYITKTPYIKDEKLQNPEIFEEIKAIVIPYSITVGFNRRIATEANSITILHLKMEAIEYITKH